MNATKTALLDSVQCYQADQGGFAVALGNFMQTRLMIIGAAGLAVPSLVLLVGARKTVNDSGATAGVVERIFAWLGRMRRLAIRHERRTDIHYTFTLLGAH